MFGYYIQGINYFVLRKNIDFSSGATLMKNIFSATTGKQWENVQIVTSAGGFNNFNNTV